MLQGWCRGSASKEQGACPAFPAIHCSVNTMLVAPLKIQVAWRVQHCKGAAQALQRSLRLKSAAFQLASFKASHSRHIPHPVPSRNGLQAVAPDQALRDSVSIKMRFVGTLVVFQNRMVPGGSFKTPYHHLSHYASSLC